jgi:exosortase A
MAFSFPTPTVLPRAAAWPAAAVACAIALAGILLLHRGTAVALVALWWGSASYNHGFLVAPIAAYLAWRRRDRLVRLQPVPCIPALALVLVAALAWWTADLAGMAAGRQLALVAMLPATLLAILGWRVGRVLALPLLYLLLMAPIGDLLVARLQLLAATVVEWAVRLSGIPVFRDGTLLEVPSGSFVVEPGCAGLSFLLSALALSVLCADLLFRGTAKRLACVAIALAAAMLLNWLRIFGLLVISELTGGSAGIIRDHLLYGWILFALAMAGLVALAQARRDGDAPPPRPAIPAAPVRGAPAPGAAPPAFAAIGLAALLLAGIPAGLGLAGAAAAPPGELPAAVGDWHLSRVRSEPGGITGFYDGARGTIELRIDRFREGGKDLLRPPLDGDWIAAGAGPAAARIGGADVSLRAIRLTDGRRQRTSWRWLAIGDRFTADWPAGLLAQALAGLGAGPPPTVLGITTEASPAPEAVLQSFLDAWTSSGMLRAIHRPRSS